MTSGEKLKKELKLRKFPIVKIHRVIDSVQTTYFIYVNSKRPTMPITNHDVLKNPGVANFYNGGKIPKESIYTPLMYIEDYNGQLNGKLYVLIDLAGKNLINRRMYEKIYYYNNELKEITLNDLSKLDTTMSNKTKKYKDIRQKLMQGANKNTKFIETIIENKDIIFKFLTEATEDPKKKEPKKQVNPNNFKLKDNPSRTYEIWMKFPNALDLLNLQENDTINQTVLTNLIEASDIELWSNDPSFHYQGFNYRLSQLDASIFSTNIKPTQWQKIHGDNFLTKHLAQILISYKFFLNQMAASLEKKLKEKNII